MLYGGVNYPVRQFHVELPQMIASIIFFEDVGFPILKIKAHLK